MPSKNFYRRAQADMEYCVDYLFPRHSFICSQVKSYVVRTGGVGEDDMESLLNSAAQSVLRSIQCR